MTRAGLILALTCILVPATPFVGPAMAAEPPSSAAPSPLPPPAERYARLRALALKIKPTDIGPSVEGVYGVVMDLDPGGGPITLVALSTGEASLYRSTDGGMVAGAGPEVAAAAKALVAQARSGLGALQPATDFPPPAAGQVRFQVLTPQGVMAGSDEEKALAGGGRPLSALFAAGREALKAMRQTAPAGR